MTALLRRRRSVEAGAFLVRSAGMVLILLLAVGRLPGFGLPEGGALPLDALIGAFGTLAVMAVSNVLALAGFLRPGGKRYDLAGAGQMLGDTVATVLIVIVVQVNWGQTVWPALSLAVVIGALRRRLPGALLVWAVAAASLAVAAVHYGSALMPLSDLTMAVMLNLLLAALSGVQASASGRHVRDLDEARRQLAHQAAHDGLTGLANRAGLAAHAASLDGRAVALLVLDLNGFKAVNDTLGHAAGDEVLQAVADRLRVALRDGDLPGRIGGDEFVVVLADADLETATELADRLRTEISRPVQAAGHPVTVGVSIGVAAREAGSPAGLDELSSAADAAMYREKAARSIPG
ncbi:GGDEF domain-containing protein [Actinoplanes bogorensis]|uniref:GGDEF domain-containing protein n=1 Tax=Paractinoplanes bogorensis TaxID=1610840 RepID=A0ABS5Z2J2_9ACTN|nr:GGDEF domain-containing protein [Actinoplanes bogorensis]MBU2669153.1 GGDEF domain-containing protein [Actinoplanes bogorensis]